jgi:hypothetical protein
MYELLKLKYTNVKGENCNNRVSAQLGYYLDGNALNRDFITLIFENSDAKDVTPLSVLPRERRWISL